MSSQSNDGGPNSTDDEPLSGKEDVAEHQRQKKIHKKNMKGKEIKKSPILSEDTENRPGTSRSCFKEEISSSGMSENSDSVSDEKNMEAVDDNMKQLYVTQEIEGLLTGHSNDQTELNLEVSQDIGTDVEGNQENNQVCEINQDNECGSNQNSANVSVRVKMAGPSVNKIKQAEECSTDAEQSQASDVEFKQDEEPDVEIQQFQESHFEMKQAKEKVVKIQQNKEPHAEFQLGEVYDNKSSAKETCVAQNQDRELDFGTSKDLQSNRTTDLLQLRTVEEISASNSNIDPNMPANNPHLTEIMSTTSTGLEVVRGEVPHISGNDPENLNKIKETNQVPLVYKRKSYAHKADDTLDDVSEIMTDFTDIPSDSSCGPMPERHSSQDTASSRKTGQSWSLRSGGKEDSYEQGEGMRSRSENAPKHQGGKTVPSNLEETSIGEAHMKQCSTDSSSSQEGNLGNLDSSDQALKDHHCVDNNVKTKNDAATTESAHSINQENEQHLLQIDRNQQARMELSTEESSDGSENNRWVVVPMEIQDGSENQSPSAAEGSEEVPERQSEEFDISNQVEERVDVIQENRRENRDDAENLSAQEGINNVSDQESNSDYQNFARGNYVGFPIDSTTTDSGIENSLAVFDRNYVRGIPENSESNEASAQGSSGASGFQHLQNWMAAAGSRRSSLSPVAPIMERRPSLSPVAPIIEHQTMEGIPGPSKAPRQTGPSTSYASNIKEKVLNLANLETIEDFPMECAEHFAETPTEGSILEMVPDVRSQCQEVIVEDNHEKPVKNQEIWKSDIAQAKNGDTVFKASESPSKKGNNQMKKKSNTKTDNNGTDKDSKLPTHTEKAKNNPTISMHQNISKTLARDDADSQSSSSLDQSRESSLADMDDAVESSDSLSKENNGQQAAASNKNLLKVLTTNLAKEHSSKHHRSKRRSRKSSANNSPFKKRKDIATCGQEAASLEPAKRKQDSDDDSSKDEDKSKK